jgi:hypothetical protein
LTIFTTKRLQRNGHDQGIPDRFPEGDLSAIVQVHVRLFRGRLYLLVPLSPRRPGGNERKRRADLQSKRHILQASGTRQGNLRARRSPAINIRAKALDCAGPLNGFPPGNILLIEIKEGRQLGKMNIQPVFGDLVNSDVPSRPGHASLLPSV